jgi:XRE family aerobic/anaerobic benzoate catabolism transcriptional regulator
MHKHENDGFLHALGARVRSRRQEAGRSIQELARLAELSPRFLSELEAGRGNISVARLARIAAALGQPLQTLIPTAAQDGSLRARVWELLEACDAEDLEQLFAWLSTRQRKQFARSIALVGVRGAGKSTIGKRVAARLRIPFVELDAEIEREAGMSLGELFALHGEGYYRRLEREAAEKLLASVPQIVLATGGSLVTHPETWGMLRRQCHTVWLKARANDHWNRVVAQGDLRPMVNNPSARDELRALLRAREPLYSQAELVMDTAKHSIGEIVGMLAKRFGAGIHPRRRRVRAATGRERGVGSRELPNRIHRFRRLRRKRRIPQRHRKPAPERQRPVPGRSVCVPSVKSA